MNESIQTGEMILMGTGTSTGVPIVGCDCDVCTSPDPKNNRTRTGVLVRTANGDFVIDTSPELRIQLLREDVKLVQAAVFTHAHADHVFGLDDLRIFGYRMNAPVPLYCEEPVEEQIRRAFYYAFNSPKHNAHHLAAPRLKFERIGLEPFDVLGQRVTPIRLFHGDLPVLGFRINDVAFCTDCNRIPDESWPLLEGLDVLVIDALREDPHPTHFGLHEAVAVAEKLGPKQTWFTHIAHWMEHEATNKKLPPDKQLAWDGLRIVF